MNNELTTITRESLRHVLGGAKKGGAKKGDPKPPDPNPDPLVSKETVGCAVGGFIGSPAGPGGAAVGCLGGAALANSIDRQKDPDKALEGLKGMGTT